MALLLTAMIESISIVNAGILLIWVCMTKNRIAARILAVIVSVVLTALTWYLFTHQVWPQWITGVGNQPSAINTNTLTGQPLNTSLSLGDVIVRVVIAMGVTFVASLLAVCFTMSMIIPDDTDASTEGLVSVGMSVALSLVMILVVSTSTNDKTMFGGAWGLDYRQVITTNTVYDERVLYENDKGITIEIGGYKGERIAWKDITSITAGKHLPTVYSNKYRVSKGYETLFIEGIWFTELHNLSGDIPEGLEDKAVIKITKVTLVSENVSFRDGTNTDVVRSTQDIKRIHIEYEVTNIDELRASVQNKEELKQFIGGE